MSIRGWSNVQESGTGRRIFTVLEYQEGNLGFKLLQPIPLVSNLDHVVAAICGVEIRGGCKARLIAISGIDGSGKGYVAARLADRLTDKGHHVALIAADGWLNLPHVRFGGDEPAEHFYSHAFRFGRDVLLAD